MRAIGFDPGTATTGYGVVERQGSRLKYIAHGIISTPPKDHYAVRLNTIFEEASRLLEMFSPDVAAIEKLFFTKNIKTGIAVAQARGILSLAVVRASVPIDEYTPLEVKNAVVGYGQADKKQVQEMVRILLNLNDIPKPDDAADALAIAICSLHSYRPATGNLPPTA